MCSLKTRIIFIALCAFTLSGCLEDLSNDTYEIQQIGSQTVLLNQRNGQTLVRKGERLIELVRYTQADFAEMAKARKLHPESAKGLEFDLKIKYREDSLQYVFNVSGQTDPVSTARGRSEKLVDPEWQKYWEEPGNILFIQFEDSESFRLAEEIVRISGPDSHSVVKIVNNDGQISSYEYVGELRLSPERYKEIRRASVVYRLKKPTSTSGL